MESAVPDLWRRWRRGRDEAAFAALVVPEIRYGHALLRKLGAGAEEAEDAIQQALVALAGEASDEPLDVGLRAWLCRRAILAFRMHVRAAVRRRRHEAAAPARPFAAPDEGVERADAVEAALARLPEPERAAVVLRYLNDLEYPLIAYVLGISVNACRIRVHKALGRLRAALGTRAGAYLALLAVPKLGSEAALVAGALSGAAAAVTAAAAAVPVKFAVKLVVALLLAGGAATTTAILATSGPRPTPTAARPAAPAPPPPAPPPSPAAARAGPPPFETLPASALELLARHFAGERDATALLWDFEALESIIPAPSGEAVRVEGGPEPVPLDLRALADRADRIELSAGRFRVTYGPRRDRRAPLEIRGAGADRTVLDLTEETLFLPTAEMAGFRLADLCVEGQRPGARTSGDALDLRGTGAAVFTRVLFRGWAAGSGAASPVAILGRGLLLFRECDFVGGYRRPAGGGAIAVRGEALALFVRCRFFDLGGVVFDHTAADPARSAVHFVDCRFDASPVADPTHRLRVVPVSPLRVRGGVVAMGRAGAAGRDRLGAWGAPILADLSGVTTEPATVRATAADLRAALDGFTPAPGQRPVGIEVLAWQGGEPVYVVHLSAADGAVEAIAFRPGPEGAVRLGPEEVLLPPLRGARVPAEGASLAALLEREWPGLDPGKPVGGFFLTADPRGAPALLVREPGGAPWLSLR